MDLGHDYDDWVFYASQFNIYEVILLKKPHHPRIQSSFYIKVLITVYVETKRCPQQKVDREKRKPQQMTWYLKPKYSNGDVKGMEGLSKNEETNPLIATYEPV